MPRDGSNVYHRPAGTDAVSNTTIESTKYNANVADVETDLNTPRPIVAGGTGANNAHDAMIALSGEIAKQGPVTNYDSFPFVNGSFYSDNGATSAPTGSTFTGIYYEHSNPAFATVEAREYVTGIQYVRQKVSGVWGAWKQQVTNAADLDAAYVNVAGDTMTGTLRLSSGDIRVSEATGGQQIVFGESSFTVGSSLPIGRYGMTYNVASGYDVGVSGWGGLSFYTGDALRFVINNPGEAFFYGNITAGRAGTTGTYYFGNTGTKLLGYDGTNFTLSGGSLGISANTVTNGYFQSQPTSTTGQYNFGNSGTKYLSYDGSNFNLIGGSLNTSGGLYLSGQTTAYLSYTGGNFNMMGGPLVHQPNASWLLPTGYGVNMSWGGSTQWGIGLRQTNDSGNAIHFLNSSGTAIGSVSVTAAAVAYNTTSSAELKEDLKSFDAGSIIDNTNVYDFKWKSTSERSFGVLAQQAVEVYPTAVTHLTSPSDNEEYWGVDYSKYVPVLLQELKALRARVAELEGRVGGDVQPA